MYVLLEAAKKEEINRLNILERDLIFSQQYFSLC